MNAYDIAKPILFGLPAETAHRLVHRGLGAIQETPIESVLGRHYRVREDRLGVEAFGLEFPNPVGVAPGFDKNAEVPRVLAALGFGFVEVGGVTALPQAGNPRPRLFRLRADEALVNRMGLHNDGAAVVGRRLLSAHAPVPVGVNIAKSEQVSEEDAPEDYRATYEEVADGGDFFVVNLSCPNSQGFEELQNKEAMTAILSELRDAGASPLLVKLSPDLPEPAAVDALAVVEELSLDGVVATNTSTDRPAALRSPNATEAGGLSGKPIESTATEMVRLAAQHVDVPIVGVGGVSTAAGAYRKIRNGASLVQLYTGLVYRGPSIAREINLGLCELLESDGFDSVADAVGVDVD
jgi:dihydroorotate dehydrogenase